MGLDVYLKYSRDRETAEQAQAAAEAEIDALWEKTGKRYEELTEDEKAAIRDQSQAIHAKHGLDDWGSSSLIEEVNEPSKIDPENMFRIGYFRSSYNAGGINSVLKRASCPDLYDIFDPQDSYNFRPDWAQALTRVNDAIDKYGAFVNSAAGQFEVMRISDIGVGGAQNEAHALEIFMENFGGDRSFKSYSNRDGNFFLDGVRVRAVIRNDATDWSRGGCYLVVDKERGEGQEDWYLTALKIVRETIEYVLSQDDPENYFFSWSA